MPNPIEQFQENITRVQAVGGLQSVLDSTTTSAVDLSDLLRAQIVMIVSALDLYIHEITRIGMLEIYNKKRPQTSAFFTVSSAFRIGNGKYRIGNAKYFRCE